MNENEKSTFEKLNSVDVSSKVKTKNGLTYLSWASAWAEIKKVCPDASYLVHAQILDEYGNKRFWFDDGRTGWVAVTVTANGTNAVETLAIMDYRNQAIPADKITSVDANKSVKRCLAKACALHGLGLYIYEGEDLPEESSKLAEQKERIKKLVNKKVELSDKAREKVIELCKVAEKQANPELGDDLITGNYKNIENAEVLATLEKQLLAIRK